MTGRPPPRVSVIVPFLDGERYLAEAVDSVLAQTFTDYEVLLVDDGSGPAATAIARRYAGADGPADRGTDGRAGRDADGPADRGTDGPGTDGPAHRADRAAAADACIRYVEHPGHQNRGLSATRNLGLEAARGELIALLDADDVWHPTKLADQVAILDAHPEVGMVCGAVNYWRSWAGGVDVTVPSGHVQDRAVVPPEASLALYPLGTAAAPCPSDLLFRRQLALDVGGFEAHFSGERQLYEDQAFLAKVYLRSPVWFASTRWLDYRQHDRSLMAQWSDRYTQVREYFLCWFEAHLAATAPDAAAVAPAGDRGGPGAPGLTPAQHRAVVRAVRRARRRNRRSRLRRAGRLPRRLLGAARRP